MLTLTVGNLFHGNICGISDGASSGLIENLCSISNSLRALTNPSVLRHCAGGSQVEL